MRELREQEFEGREAAAELAGPLRMTSLLLVALGGLVGASLRYLLEAAVVTRFGSDFPWGTLAINLIGAFGLGVLTVLTVERELLPLLARPAFGIGLLGAFTTFSTYAVETIVLAEGGRMLRAATYVVATNVAGVGAAVAGFALARGWGSS